MKGSFFQLHFSFGYIQSIMLIWVLLGDFGPLGIYFLPLFGPAREEEGKKHFKSFREFDDRK